MWAVTSLWPQKLVCRSQIYLARAQLMLISDQARDLVKECFESGLLCPFQNGSFTSGILNNWLCQESLPEFMWRKRELLREMVIWWYFTRIKCGNIVPGWLWIVLSVPGKWLIVWCSEVVDRQNSCMSWCSCYKNTVFKHKNASWVLSWSDFVLDNRILGSRKVDSRSVLVGHLAMSPLVWETERS